VPHDDRNEGYPADDGDAECVPCPSCGAGVYEETQKCPCCGDWIDPQSSSARMPSWIRLAALVVLAAILLGVVAGLIHWWN
jgi:hypothetical protein